MPSNLTSISFPASPALNDTYTYGNQTYQWNGTEWVVSYDSNSIPIGAVTLSGNQTITGIKTFSNNIVANSNLTVDTNTLFVNSSTDRVGVSTLSPNTKLEITVPSTGTTLTGLSSYGGIHLNQTTTNNEFVGITTSATSTGTHGGILFQGSGGYGTKIHFLTTDQYIIGMQNRMTLNHFGNLGIGTTSPSEKLDVNGNIKLSSATGVIKDASDNTAINVQKLGGGGRYIRQVEVQTYTSNLSVPVAGVDVIFNNITGFKTGSLIKLTVYIPARGDGTAGTWRGLYCEPAISYNNGTNYYSMGNTGYTAGNIMNTYSGVIGNSTHVYIINPETKQLNGNTPVGYTSGSDFSMKFLLKLKAYALGGTSGSYTYPTVNYGNGINENTSYGTVITNGTALGNQIIDQNCLHIIVEELATLS